MTIQKNTAEGVGSLGAAYQNTDNIIITPYGVFHRTNGDLVLFNRDYQPIFHYVAEVDEIFATHPDWWVSKIDSQSWFYNDASSPFSSKETRRICAKVLDDWTNGKATLPRHVIDNPIIKLGGGLCS
jgi:hypothetical protein